MKFLLFTLLAAASAPLSAAAADSARTSSSLDLQAKVALEASVERRLQDVLRRTLDADDVVAIVNADLVSDAERADGEVMPGVMVKQTPGVIAPLEMPASLVRRISVTIFIPKDSPDAKVQLAKSLSERLIGIKPERGDVLAVERMDFPKRVKPAPEPVSWRDQLMNPRWLFMCAWLLLGAAALMVVSRRFLAFAQAMREAAVSLGKSASSSRRPDDAAAPAAAQAAAAAPPAAPAAHAEASGEPPRRIPFSFVRERDVPTMNALLHDQPVQTVAAIVHYLPPSVAAQTLSAMGAEKLEAVISQMSRPVLLNPDDVAALEESVRARIDSMVGGEDKLAEILEQSAVPMQTEILTSLHANDPELWDKLQRRIVVFDDLALLDEAGLAALSRSVPLKSMAAALKTNPALSERVMSKLKTGLGEWLKQEIDLAGELPPDVAQAETRKVVSALARLAHEGKVVLRKESVLPAHDAGAARLADVPEPSPEPDAQAEGAGTSS